MVFGFVGKTGRLSWNIPTSAQGTKLWKAQYLCLQFERLPHGLDVGFETHALHNIYWICHAFFETLIYGSGIGPAWEGEWASSASGDSFCGCYYKDLTYAKPSEQQDAESWCRQPAELREPQGRLWEGQEAAVTPPALQHMPQQPRAVVAIGVPVQEPAVGLPNNVFYTGHAVDTRPQGDS